MKKRQRIYRVKGISPTNIEDVYKLYFNRFLFDFSDEVIINGKVYTDKLKRWKMTLPNLEGEPNIKSAISNDMKDGFPLTELDFVEYELDYIKDLESENITEKKQIRLYRNYLENRRTILFEKEGCNIHSFNTDEYKELTTRNIIVDSFSFMLKYDPRKHRKILSENDFDSLVNWVEYYFENEFQLPVIDTPIKNVNTSKGNVVFTFMKLYKELYPASTRPDSLFELIKNCFYEYRDDKLDNLKKTKEPQYYRELIRK